MGRRFNQTANECPHGDTHGKLRSKLQLDSMKPTHKQHIHIAINECTISTVIWMNCQTNLIVIFLH